MHKKGNEVLGGCCLTCVSQVDNHACNDKPLQQIKRSISRWPVIAILSNLVANH